MSVFSLSGCLLLRWEFIKEKNKNLKLFSWSRSGFLSFFLVVCVFLSFFLDSYLFTWSFACLFFFFNLLLSIPTSVCLSVYVCVSDVATITVIAYPLQLLGVLVLWYPKLLCQVVRLALFVINQMLSLCPKWLLLFDELFRKCIQRKTGGSSQNYQYCTTMRTLNSLQRNSQQDFVSNRMDIKICTVHF